MKNRKAMLLITVILLLAFLIFNACQKQKLPQPVIKVPAEEVFKASHNNNNYRVRDIKENRVLLFIDHLNQLGAEINTPKELLKKACDSQDRQQLSEELGIDPFCILVHVELADLLQLGLSEIDAQLLHFSQWNYLNLFTGEIINSAFLANADPEKIAMDISGWAAGSQNPIVQQYKIGISEIEEWINIAANSGDCVIQYSNWDPSRFEGKLSCD